MSVERRARVVIIGVLLSLAAVAWAETVRQSGAMSGMAMGVADIGRKMAPHMAVPVFMGMWTAMMCAMMLPTVAPMVLAHRMVVRGRGEGPLPSVAFVAGYLVIWTAAGVIPLAVFLGFRLGAAPMAPPGWLGWAAGGALVAAGAYQFTPWKAACARACRSPMSFLMTHDFRRGAGGAARVGVSHGLWCLGCCWALMAVLLVVGLMNLVWMAAITVVFVAERTWRHGEMLTKVVGAATAAVGVVVMVWPAVLAWLSRAGGM